MKIYSDQSGRAPSPRRVRIFIYEKGINVDVVRMELHKENRTDEFRQKNPMGNLPVLELDDGVCISESMAICRYLEEVSPEPRLFGSDPLEKATVEMWNRRSELAFYLPIEYAGGFLGEEVAAGARKRVARMLNLFDTELGSREFIAGTAMSVADITTKVAIDFGIRFNDIDVPEELENFRRWQSVMESRPSSAA
jgi:glutathione S-transferase